MVGLFVGDAVGLVGMAVGETVEVEQLSGQVPVIERSALVLPHAQRAATLGQWAARAVAERKMPVMSDTLVMFQLPRFWSKTEAE